VSKTYVVRFSKAADKALTKMDSFEKQLVVSWIEDKLEGCTNPRIHGKSLTGELSGKWRYRVGSYRIIAEILDSEIVIYILDIGHRSDIYKKP